MNVVLYPWKCNLREEVVCRRSQQWHLEAKFRKPEEVMCWSDYKVYFMSPDRGEDQLTEPQVLKAWLRDLQGHNGVESFKKTVYNRKTGENEERQFVWVQAVIDRRKEEETRATKSSTLKDVTKEYTSQQRLRSRCGAVRIFAHGGHFSWQAQGTPRVLVLQSRHM